MPLADDTGHGADLYDPAESDGQRGICYVYLAEGSYGFVGSTATSYGPAEGNGQADLLCQYFLERVLRGASTGRALLEARQRLTQLQQDVKSRSATNEAALAAFERGIAVDSSFATSSKPRTIETMRRLAGQTSAVAAE